MTPLQDRILLRLRAVRDPMTASDLASFMNSTPASIRTAINGLRRALREEGGKEEVVSVGRGYSVRRSIP